MKIKATRKQMRSYDKIISIGYCHTQSLLRYQEPIAYSAGVNGWDCDYYLIGDVLISTGYRPIKGNCPCSYSLVEKYESMAREASSLDYEMSKKAVNIILDRFIDEVSQRH